MIVRVLRKGQYFHNKSDLVKALTHMKEMIWHEKMEGGQYVKFCFNCKMWGKFSIQN